MPLRFIGQLYDLYPTVRRTGGGPGNLHLPVDRIWLKMALGSFDLGPAAGVLSIMYYLVILLTLLCCFNVP